MLVDGGRVPGVGMPPPIGIPVAGLIAGATGIPVLGTPPGMGLVGAPPGTLGTGLMGIVPVPPGIPPGIIVGGAFVPVPGTVFVVTLGTAGLFRRVV